MAKERYQSSLDSYVVDLVSYSFESLHVCHPLVLVRVFMMCAELYHDGGQSTEVHACDGCAVRSCCHQTEVRVDAAPESFLLCKRHAVVLFSSVHR